VKQLLSSEGYDETKAAAESFAEARGPELQAVLEQRNNQAAARRELGTATSYVRLAPLSLHPNVYTPTFTPKVSLPSTL
jgi:hypothetical protein